MNIALFQSAIKSLRLINRGKVRDVYAVDDQHLLIVTTDRLSAFDVVLPTPIPGKGEVLTAISNFWFERLKYVRDWLEASGWQKQAPGPELPPEVAARTGEKYREALKRLADN